MTWNSLVTWDRSGFLVLAASIVFIDGDPFPKLNSYTFQPVSLLFKLLNFISFTSFVSFSLFTMTRVPFSAFQILKHKRMVNIAVVWLATNLEVCSVKFYFMWLHTLDTIRYILLASQYLAMFSFHVKYLGFHVKILHRMKKIHTMKLSHMNQHYLLWWSVFQIFSGIL